MMKMRVFIPVLLIAITAASARASEERQLLIPLVAAEATLSPQMEAFRDEVLAERLTTRPFAGWEPLGALPEWVWQVERREIAFIAPRLMIQHDFRYALILGRNGETIVVREGGLAGMRDIYFQQREPNSAPPSMPASSADVSG